MSELVSDDGGLRAITFRAVALAAALAPTEHTLICVAFMLTAGGK